MCRMVYSDGINVFKLHNREGRKVKKIKYKGLKIIIKEVPYQFEYYCTNLNGYIILFLNKALTQKHKSNILHKIIKRLEFKL